MSYENTSRGPLATADQFQALLEKGLAGEQAAGGDPVVQAAIGGIAHKLASRDPNERARGARGLDTLLGEEVTFRESPYSGEELESGLMGLMATATDLEGPVSEGVRAAFHIPVPESTTEPPGERNPFAFTAEETTIAAALVYLGLGVADEVKKSGKGFVRPDVIWSRERLVQVQKELVTAGLIQGEPAELSALIEGTYAKLTHRLEATIEANEALRRKARRDLDKM